MALRVGLRATKQYENNTLLRNNISPRLSISCLCFQAVLVIIYVEFITTYFIKVFSTTAVAPFTIMD